MIVPGRLVLVGHPVAHSLSPAFQNAALRSAGIPLVYEALDVRPDALRATLERLTRERAAGNVTIPHKRAAFELCASHTPVAERVGAVNTFWTDGDALAGDNTDVGGFQRAVVGELGHPPRGPIALLGAGGSAAAVCAAAEEWDVDIRVLARSQSSASALAMRFAKRASVVSTLDAALAGAALVVNATPVGMHDDDGLPLPVALLPDDALIVDLVYRPGATALVRQARAVGRRAIDGLSMLVEQGALSFERWFGVEPDRHAMWRAVG